MKDDTWKWILSIGGVGLLGWMILGKNEQAPDMTEDAADDDAEYPPMTDAEYYNLRPHLLLRGKEAADWFRENHRDSDIYEPDDLVGRQILAESMATRAKGTDDEVLMAEAKAEIDELILDMRDEAEGAISDVRGSFSHVTGLGNNRWS